MLSQNNIVEDKLRLEQGNILTLDTFSIIICSILIFVMGKFQLTELLGIKRALQVILVFPIIVYAIIQILKIRSSIMLNPLFLLSILFIVFNIIFNRDIIALTQYITTTLAIITILTVSYKNIILGVKWIVSLTTFFSILSILQLILCFLFPSLVDHLQTEGFSLIKSFGFMTKDVYLLFGIKIGRIHSFLTEPSLVIIHFAFPAVLALFLNSKFWANCAAIIIIFCFLTLSASFYICVVFILFYWVSSLFLAQRFIITFFPIFFFLVIIFNTEQFNDLIAISSSYGENSELLNKTSSLNIRGSGIILAISEAKRVKPT